MVYWSELLNTFEYSLRFRYCKTPLNSAVNGNESPSLKSEPALRPIGLNGFQMIESSERANVILGWYTRYNHPTVRGTIPAVLGF